MAFDRSFPQSLASPVIADSEHFWPRLRCSPLRLKTASAFGSIDCSLHSLQSSVTSLASCGFTTASTPCGHKLSSHFHSHFSPDTSGCAYGVGFVPITVCPETSACFSEPSMSCCRAPSSITHLRHTDSRAPPTHRGRSRLHSTPPARSLPYIVRDAVIIRPCRAERIYRLRPTASLIIRPPLAPDGRCADAQTPLRQTANRFAHSEFTYGLGQGQVGRLSNRERI